MIKSFRINNFKTLDMEREAELKNINVFYGQNGAGKSSILEAITLFLSSIGRRDYEIIIAEEGFINTDLPFPWRGKKLSYVIKDNMLNGSKNFSITLTFNEEPPLEYKVNYHLIDKMLLLSHNIKFNDINYSVDENKRYEIFSDEIINYIRETNSNKNVQQKLNELRNIFNKYRELKFKAIPNQLSNIPDRTTGENEGMLSLLAKLFVPREEETIKETLIQLIKHFNNFHNIDIWSGWVGGTEIEGRTIYDYNDGKSVINLGEESFGFKRLLEILFYISKLKQTGGIILIEEPEIGLSLDNILELSKRINEHASHDSSRNYIQFIITTHNPLIAYHFDTNKTKVYNVIKEKGVSKIQEYEFNNDDKEKLKQIENSLGLYFRPGER